MFAATNLFKMLLKYRPEDKAAKKERLLKRAQAENEGKTVESKKPIVVKYGLNHVTYLIEQVCISTSFMFIFTSLDDSRQLSLCIWLYCIIQLHVILAEQGSACCHRSRRGSDRTCCVASSPVQEDGGPILHC